MKKEAVILKTDGTQEVVILDIPVLPEIHDSNVVPSHEERLSALESAMLAMMEV